MVASNIQHDLSHVSIIICNNLASILTTLQMEFLVFIMIVTILLVNLLIAMMGNTYGWVEPSISIYHLNVLWHESVICMSSSKIKRKIMDSTYG